MHRHVTHVYHAAYVRSGAVLPGDPPAPTLRMCVLAFTTQSHHAPCAMGTARVAFHCCLCSCSLRYAASPAAASHAEHRRPLPADHPQGLRLALPRPDGAGAGRARPRALVLLPQPLLNKPEGKKRERDKAPHVEVCKAGGGGRPVRLMRASAAHWLPVNAGEEARLATHCPTHIHTPLPPPWPAGPPMCHLAMSGWSGDESPNASKKELPLK